MKRFRKNKKGFSLVELIVVITVLGILAVIAVPIIGDVVTRANNNADAANVALFQSAIERFTDTPTTATPVGGGGVYPATAAAAANAIKAFANIQGGTIPTPRNTANNFYYNTSTHIISCKAAAAANDVEIDGL